MIRKPTYYAHGHDFYRALSRILDPEVYDLKAKDRYEPQEYGERLDRETREILTAFLDWFGKTPGGMGLTAETEKSFSARVDIGVSVVREASGTIMICVPRQEKPKCP